MAVVHGTDLGTHVLQERLDQQQVGRVVVDAEQARCAAGRQRRRLAALRALAEQLEQGLLHLVRAGWLGQHLAVRLG